MSFSIHILCNWAWLENSRGQCSDLLCMPDFQMPVCQLQIFWRVPISLCWLRTYGHEPLWLCTEQLFPGVGNVTIMDTAGSCDVKRERCVCVYVFMHVSMCVCACVCVYLCMYPCVGVLIYPCVCIYACIHMCGCVCTHLSMCVCFRVNHWHKCFHSRLWWDGGSKSKTHTHTHILFLSLWTHAAIWHLSANWHCKMQHGVKVGRLVTVPTIRMVTDPQSTTSSVPWDPQHKVRLFFK